MKNADQPAFPMAIPASSGNDSYTTDGLTKREYFAAMALQGLLANEYVLGGNSPSFTHTENINMRVLSAIIHADALLAELEKPLTSSKSGI